MERKVFTVLPLREQPQLLQVAAQWFHSKWQIPCQAYVESMQACRTGTAFLPQWYVILDASGTIIAGAGLIANDFHERKDLTPNVCALYVEKAWRGNGYARMLLDHIRREAGREGLSRLYLITDHTVFYEACGWEYVSMIREDSGNSIRMYTAKAL